MTGPATGYLSAMTPLTTAPRIVPKTLITCSGCGWSAWVRPGDVVRTNTTGGGCSAHYVERGAP